MKLTGFSTISSCDVESGGLLVLCYKTPKNEAAPAIQSASPSRVIMMACRSSPDATCAQGIKNVHSRLSEDVIG